jgi:hypothetical protein
MRIRELNRGRVNHLTTMKLESPRSLKAMGRQIGHDTSSTRGTDNRYLVKVAVDSALADHRPGPSGRAPDALGSATGTNPRRLLITNHRKPEAAKIRSEEA